MKLENRTLYSRRIEDEIYREVREGRDGMLSELEKQAQGKLPGIGDLSVFLVLAIFFFAGAVSFTFSVLAFLCA